MKTVTRNKPAWGDGIVIFCVLLLAILITLALGRQASGPLSAQITLDGALVGTYELSKLNGPLLVSIDAPYPLSLELSQGGVHVAHTHCPGQDCLHTGTISRAGRQIICLPNRLIVTLIGATPEYDAISG